MRRPACTHADMHTCGGRKRVNLTMQLDTHLLYSPRVTPQRHSTPAHSQHVTMHVLEWAESTASASYSGICRSGMLWHQALLMLLLTLSPLSPDKEACSAGSRPATMALRASRSIDFAADLISTWCCTGHAIGTHLCRASRLIGCQSIN